MSKFALSASALALAAGPRIRGIVSARAEGDELTGLVRQANQELSQWIARNGARIDAIEAAVNSQQEALDAERIGSATARGPVHPGAGLRGQPGRERRLSASVAADLHSTLRGLPSASMSTQSNPDGGYTVEPEIDNVLDGVMRDLSPMRQLARVVSLANGRGDWEKIVGRTGGATAWVGEEETRVDLGNPTLGKITISPAEIYAMPELTNNLIDDSMFDLQGFLQEDVAGEFSLAEGQAFVDGDGFKKPKGFLSYPTAETADATRAFGTLQFVKSGNASALATSNPGDALYDVLAALRPAYRKGDGVGWLMNSATANTLMKLKDGQGNYLWSPALAAGQPDRLLGYPVAIDEGMPDIAANAYPVAFGNWRRGYAIVDKPGLRLIVDRVTKKGWTKMYFYKRVGGGVVDSNAIKLLKIAA